MRKLSEEIEILEYPETVCLDTKGRVIIPSAIRKMHGIRCKEDMVQLELLAASEGYEQGVRTLGNVEVTNVVDGRGRISLPSKIMKACDLKPGEYLSYRIKEIYRN